MFHLVCSPLFYRVGLETVLRVVGCLFGFVLGFCFVSQVSNLRLRSAVGIATCSAFAIFLIATITTLLFQ